MNPRYYGSSDSKETQHRANTGLFFRRSVEKNSVYPQAAGTGPAERAEIAVESFWGYGARGRPGKGSLTDKANGLQGI